VDRNNEFKYAAGPLEAATCKTCGAEISTNVAKTKLPNGAVYLYPKGEGDQSTWHHPAVANMVLNNEATLSGLKGDAEWDHEAEPADGRSHEEDYAYHVFKVRNQNIANGCDPKESENFASNDFNIKHDLRKGGNFGVV